jgi:Saxitoxin biosynthesis operon protein SxtJ
MPNQTDKKQLRSFGLTVGGIFAGIGVWPLMIHSAEPRWWSLIIAALLILPALVYPTSLFWIHKSWIFVGYVLGWINTRIILGLVFFAVVTPIGIFRRVLGKDPMGRKLRTDLDSYRVIREPRQASH